MEMALEPDIMDEEEQKPGTGMLADGTDTSDEDYSG